MVTVRLKKRLKDPPPAYTPRGVYLTVTLQWGGEFRINPVAYYFGGEMVKFDWVLANILGIESLTNSSNEYCGKPLGKQRKFYILVNNSFRILSIDEDVRVWAIKHTPLKEMIIYVDDVVVEHGGEDNREDGGDMSEEMEKGNEQSECEGHGTEDEDEYGGDRLEEIEKGNEHSECEGQGQKRKGKSVCEGKGKEKCVSEDGDSSEIEDFNDSDYSMREESEDDDTMFDNNVSVEQQNRIVNSDSTGSSSDEDVVFADGDFDDSKDSDGEQRGPNQPVFKPKVIFKPEFELGMIFSNRAEFKQAVQSCAINEKRSVVFTKNAPDRCYARCKDSRCGWKLTLLRALDEETYQVTQYEPKHTCAPSYKVTNVKSPWLCDKFMNKFVADPNRPVPTFLLDASSEIGCDISLDQAYIAKRLALKKLEGDPADQYTKLWDYAEEIKRTNTGSTIIIGTEEDSNRFSRLYICLDAVKKGFKAGCRPIIGVDGCHLKGPHKGILLTAVGVDGNNCLYPLAWAVVSTEAKETWEWFLICLKHDLELFKDYEYTFMSDKQKGLIQAFGEIFPDAQHRFCVRHLHGNFKSAGFRGLAFKQALWNAANATTLGEWNTKMVELRNLNDGACEWVSAKPADQWSKSHFSENPKCDILLNNLCESFNSSILKAREMPILTMLEWIREWLMIRFQKNRDVAAGRWKGRICPKIKKILEKYINLSTTCIPIKSDRFNYQVRCHDGSQVCVNLEEHTCSCRVWDLSGIPCKHAISAITHQRGDLEDYISEWYTVECYKKSYAPIIKGTNGASLWADTSFIPPLPPNMGRGKGRPAAARRNEPDEPQRKSKKKERGRRPTRLKRRQVTLTCRNCGCEGHNSKSCGGAIQVRTKTGGSRLDVGGSSRNDAIPLKHLMTTPTVIMLPPLPQSQNTMSELIEEEIPTQQSQTTAKRAGLSMWNQLKHKKRVNIGGPSTEEGRKYISLSTLQSIPRGKK